MTTRRRAHVDAAVIADVGAGADVVLPDDAAHRFARVLRLPRGAPIELFDGSGRVVEGTFDPGPPARLVDAKPAVRAPELPPFVVAQAVVKTDKLEAVVQKGTELGAAAFVLFEAARGVVKLGDKAAARVERLARVAEDAARQSLRAHAPIVEGPLSVDGLCDRVRAFAGVAVVGVVGAPAPLSAVLARAARFEADGVLVVVGPEGGLSDDEVSRLVAAGAVPVGLGAHVLRTETAALAALAAAQATLGRL